MMYTYLSEVFDALVESGDTSHNTTYCMTIQHSKIIMYLVLLLYHRAHALTFLDLSHVSNLLERHPTRPLIHRS